MIKILRPSCLISSIRTFVEEHMSSQFIATGTIDLTEMYEESDAKTPLIFILSPGICYLDKNFAHVKVYAL